MQRGFVAVLATIAALLITAPLAAAHDRGPGGWDGPGDGQSAGPGGGQFGSGFPGPPRGWWREHDDDVPEGGSDIHVVAGVVASVDATGNTLSVTLRGCRDVPGPMGHGRRDDAGDGDHGDDDDVPTNVTVKADADTLIVRNGQEAVLGDIKAGDKVMAEIATEEDTTFAEALASPAWLIVAKGAKPKLTFYGFGGRIVSVDAATGKVTVNVRTATISARRLLGAGARELVFTVDDDTMILKRGRADIGDLAANDIVGVGIRAAKGATLDAVVATPAKRVMALSPVSSATSARKAMRRLSLRAAGVRR